MYCLEKSEKSVNQKWQQVEIAMSSIIAEFDSRINNVVSVVICTLAILQLFFPAGVSNAMTQNGVGVIAGPRGDLIVLT